MRCRSIQDAEKCEDYYEKIYSKRLGEKPKIGKPCRNLASNRISHKSKNSPIFFLFKSPRALHHSCHILTTMVYAKYNTKPMVRKSKKSFNREHKIHFDLSWCTCEQVISNILNQIHSVRVYQ